MVKLKEIIVLAPSQALVSQQNIAIRARFTDGQKYYEETADFFDIDGESPQALAEYFERLAAQCRKHAKRDGSPF
jgi:hypothetical protein